MSETTGKALTLQELPDLRRKTDAVANLLREQVASHLETLRPLFAPERVFGKYAGGRIDPQGAERAYLDLQQKYRPFSAKPYELAATFDASWLTLVGTAMDVRPWEYVAQIQGRPIAMTSPVKWILGYKSSLPLSQVRSLLATRATTHRDELRQTIVNALVLQVLLGRHPGIESLFRDLRLELAVETLSDLPGFPIVTITSCLPSFRPADDLVLAATAFSGVSSFIELIDLEAARQPHDRLREKIERLLA